MSFIAGPYCVPTLVAAEQPALVLQHDGQGEQFEHSPALWQSRVRKLLPCNNLLPVSSE